MLTLDVIAVESGLSGSPEFSMKIQSLYPWDSTIGEAKIVQQQLSQQVIAIDRLPAPITYVAGADVGFKDGDKVVSRHPRRFGLACHLGLMIDTPTIGVAKSRLIGQHAEVGNERGSWQPLLDQEQTMEAVLRTRQNVKPLYISIGHRISLPTAINYVL